MKKLIRNCIRLFGFDVVRYKRKAEKKSVRNNKITKYSTKTGIYYLPTDAYQDIVVQTIIDNKIYDEAIFNCAKEFIKPSTVVLDIGSNFGQMAILFSGEVGPEGKVYAFEADDFIFENLEKNIAANNCQNVLPIFGAVHNVPDSYLFFPEQNFEKFSSYGSFGIDYKTNTGRKIKTLTIDNLEIMRPVSFMKIDIQGGDLFALKGAVNTIKRNQMPIIFEFETELQETLDLNFQEYVDFVRDIDYKFSRIINGSNFLIMPANMQLN